MFPTVFTVAKKLVSLVQGGPLLWPHNVVNFCQTKSTEFGGGVEGGGPGDDVPGDGVGDIHVLQPPYVATQLAFCPLGWVFETWGMLAVPLFEERGQTSVGFFGLVIQPSYSGLVDHILSCAPTRQRTVCFFWNLTITSLSANVVAVHCFHHFGVVSVNIIFDVRHAPITQLDSVPVEISFELVRKFLIHYFQKFCPHLSCYIFGKRGVEPKSFSFPLQFFNVVVVDKVFIGELMFTSTSFKFITVNLYRIFKHLLVGWDVGKPFIDSNWDVLENLGRMITKFVDILWFVIRLNEWFEYSLLHIHG